ncbi:MAG: hypothetical protein V4472_04475 [Pseudomonadota bacterium]
MTDAAQPPLFSSIMRPSFQLSSPDRLLSEDQYERIALTIEDFRYVTREMTEDLDHVPAEIRARGTILRRLLSERDLFNVGQIMPPPSGLRVRARMLDFDPIHPALLLSCGNYPWAGDRLDGVSSEFSIKGVARIQGAPWKYRDDTDVSLSEYLEGLSFAILGTPVRRREIIKYVGDKKSAHVSDKRKHVAEQAIDRVWSQLYITMMRDDGQSVRLNQVYLEILAIIDALSASPSIQGYIGNLERWIGTAQPVFPNAKVTHNIQLPMKPR